MKVLLDENLPKKLKFDLSEFEVYTVREKGWNGKENGELLKLLSSEDFKVLLTFDQNIMYQQNITKFKVTVFVLKAIDNTYITLKELVPKIRKELEKPLNIEIKKITLE